MWKRRSFDAGRLTKDIDIIVRREDLNSIATAVRAVGLRYSRDAGADRLVQEGAPPGRRAVNMYFTGERVRLVPLADLVRMKLTSFRLKDQVHIKDLDEVHAITAEIEESLSRDLRGRLAAVRAHA